MKVNLKMNDYRITHVEILNETAFHSYIE